jgi:hypothetical protein
MAKLERKLTAAARPIHGARAERHEGISLVAEHPSRSVAVKS